MCMVNTRWDLYVVFDGTSEAPLVSLAIDESCGEILGDVKDRHNYGRCGYVHHHKHRDEVTPPIRTSSSRRGGTQT